MLASEVEKGDLIQADVFIIERLISTDGPLHHRGQAGGGGFDRAPLIDFHFSQHSHLISIEGGRGGGFGGGGLERIEHYFGNWTFARDNQVKAAIGQFSAWR